ncbi:MAG: protein-disulfide reductase DsbD [Rhizobacter sp.]|jgi:thiol:disulfide interchange protein DsbD
MNLLRPPALVRAAAALLAWAALAVPAVAATDDFLDPDKAFVLSASVASPTSVVVRFDIAPGYRMYREPFAFEAAGASASVKADVPAGERKFDDTFQKEVETYRGTLEIPVQVRDAKAPLTVNMTSQGCADAGLCYPPQQHALRLLVAEGSIVGVSVAPATGDDTAAPSAATTPDVAATSGTTSQAEAPAVEAATGASGRIESALQSGSLLVVAGVFLVAGLLLSFTPCVLPMVPILSSIIVGQAGPVSRARGFGLAVSYCLGMALVYTAFGVVAGLLGEGLAASMQNPWVLGAFAALLALLSLSMFGMYELQMPNFLQSKVTEASGRLPGGKFAGVFAMGGLSALIVGPCVAAPLAGALVYISRTHDVMIGAVALFSLACGMSAPLLLVGLSAGSLLPRTGAWMERVKHAFGVMLLAVALWLVSPVLPAWALMSLTGALLTVTAVYMGAFDRLGDTVAGSTRLFKGVGVVLALVGAAQFVGALSGGRDTLQPLAHLASRGGKAADAAHAGPSFKRVRTVAELEQAVASAGRPVMLDFYADWCVSCKEYERFTFQDEQVRRRLGDFELLQVDVTANSADDKTLLKRFGLFGPPGIVFFDPQGREKSAARVVGYQAGPEFLRSLDAAAL